MLLIDKIDLYKNGKERNLFIYEGPAYNSGDNPIIIFGFDGNNLFNPEHASYGKSWKVNKVLENLGIYNYLVFGLQCEDGMERVAEYSPTPYWKDLVLDRPLPSKPYGLKHIKAINEILIPYVEEIYDFKLSETKSVMMGSSCGGVMSTYYSSIYPHKFSSYLAMSPAYWVNAPYIHDVVKNSDYDAKLYMDMGGKETSGNAIGPEEYIDNFEIMKEILKGKDVKWRFHPEDEHSEIFWNKRLPVALKWLLGIDE